MVNLRPHVLKWRTLDGPAGETPEGFPIPGTPGEEKEIGCRFHDSKGGSKVFKNEDFTESAQVGQIRCDVGDIPQVGQMVQVVEGDYVHFSGIVREVFKGQLSHRLEV